MTRGATLRRRWRPTPQHPPASAATGVGVCGSGGGLTHSPRITHRSSLITHHSPRITHHSSLITHAGDQRRNILLLQLRQVCVCVVVGGGSLTHHASHITHKASSITHSLRITHYSSLTAHYTSLITHHLSLTTSYTSLTGENSSHLLSLIINCLLAS